MTLLGIILGLAPGFAWLFFYMKEDPHPEPKRLVALTFVIGMASAFVALIIERIVNGVLPKSVYELASPITNYQWLYLAVLAVIEEAVKFGAAYFAVYKSPDFDEPVDAMVYMVIAALGFATMENLGAIGTSASGGTQAAMVNSLITTVSLRFVGATLLHSLTAALVGYYWAMGIHKWQVKRYLLLGFVLASGLHAFFNFLIIEYGNVIFIGVFLLIFGFFILGDFEKLKGKIV